MRHKFLHDLAKFAAGLILGDFLCGVWFLNNGFLSGNFLGMTVSQEFVWAWLIVDAALFILLVNYGWHAEKLPILKQRTFLVTAGVIFAVVALVHLLRVFLGADLSVFGWSAPLWMSWIGTAVAAYMSYMSFHLVLKP